MNYHDITKEDLLNGPGVRVVLWVSGCCHHCKNCQNPITWDECGGLPFDEAAEKELFEALDKPYIDGITFSGGDPLYTNNRKEVCRLIRKCRKEYPDKSIWLYTGYKWEDVKDIEELKLTDVVAEGPFVEKLKDNNIEWVGSSNQRVIDIKKTINSGKITTFSYQA